MSRRALTLLAVLVIISAGIALAVRNEAVNSTSGADPSGDAATVPARTLADAGNAHFISIMVYDGNGGVSSFMVGGKTDEFKAFTAAVRDARPVDQPADASFSDLLVFSFGRQDTLEASYSRTRNLLMLGDQAYRPAADLAPMIADVEKRFAQ